MFSKPQWLRGTNGLRLEKVQPLSVYTREDALGGLGQELSVVEGLLCWEASQALT